MRGAISLANGDIYNTYIVMLPAGTYTLDEINGEGQEDDNITGDLDIRAGMTIQGASRTTVFIEPEYYINDRVIHIFQPGASGVADAGNMTVMISGVTIRNGNTPLTGGGLQIEAATLNMFDSSIVENASVGQGGGIANINSILNISDVLFDGNQSTDGDDSVSNSTECGGAFITDQPAVLPSAGIPLSTTAPPGAAAASASRAVRPPR